MQGWCKWFTRDFFSLFLNTSDLHVIPYTKITISCRFCLFFLGVVPATNCRKCFSFSVCVCRWEILRVMCFVRVNIGELTMSLMCVNIIYGNRLFLNKKTKTSKLVAERKGANQCADYLSFVLFQINSRASIYHSQIGMKRCMVDLCWDPWSVIMSHDKICIECNAWHNTRSRTKQHSDFDSICCFPR